MPFIYSRRRSTNPRHSAPKAASQNQGYFHLSEASAYSIGEGPWKNGHLAAAEARVCKQNLAKKFILGLIARTYGGNCPGPCRRVSRVFILKCVLSLPSLPFFPWSNTRKSRFTM
ncbi:unnamed protein product [Kuraishia capsulata CBS 1993]|uniref:Uncharacterized protein n=1 Tax=Kuraishia capsulata CBS 1993 TaxID=1382522 RepID=W6MWG6_9ASCO|nr:uncharacterized protein KUCA_T00003388001 [Kuraishia capsulata CBS 1993]CDK27410.1 unnamed protein product [Kuraishia capsulata CBS 1993]